MARPPGASVAGGRADRFLVGASVLDATPGDNAVAARRLVGLGVLAAVPTTATGLSDWSDTAGAEQRVGALHAGLNLTALGLYSGSWLARRRSTGGGTALAVVGGVVLAGAGYLGGHLAYALGVGIDTNAFQTGPGQWQAVAAEADVDDERPHAVSAGGVSLLVLKQNGRIHVLANRCTHRGAPLSDGRVDQGCITCPWHGSVFDLGTGAVRRGPATQPQPVYETRVVEWRHPGTPARAPSVAHQLHWQRVSLGRRHGYMSPGAKLA